MCAQLTSRTREALDLTWLDGIRVVDLTLDTLTPSPRLVRLRPYLCIRFQRGKGLHVSSFISMP